MKATGIVRHIDNLGRIVLPKELRDTYGWNVSDGIEIFTDADTIILHKYNVGCIFCGSMHELEQVNGKNVCGYCRNDLRK
jgi:transcriptional pleiotropic regulator of transition state genes